MPSNSELEMLTLLKQISTRENADICFFFGDIKHENVDSLIEEVNSLPFRHENVILVLTTYGGSPDAAYRITRFLKSKYTKLILFVFGYCKSAGTLIAVGADAIVMSEYGELGPLDMQVTKEDELINESSLTCVQAVVSLKEYASTFFDDIFITLKRNSGYSITTKTASDIAVSLVTGILAPIASQIDPLRLVEVQRALNTAIEYGNRLNTKNDREILAKLSSNYPSHGFVIDIEEAKQLFSCVREPDETENRLARLLHKGAREPIFEMFKFIFTKANEQELEDEPRNNRDRECDSGAVQDDSPSNSGSEQIVSDSDSQAVSSVATDKSGEG